MSKPHMMNQLLNDVLKVYLGDPNRIVTVRMTRETYGSLTSEVEGTAGYYLQKEHKVGGAEVIFDKALWSAPYKVESF